MIFALFAPGIFFPRNDSSYSALSENASLKEMILSSGERFRLEATIARLRLAVNAGMQYF